MYSFFTAFWFGVSFLIASFMMKPLKLDDKNLSSTESSKNEWLLLQFGEESVSYWQVVNDGVMGGRSRSRLEGVSDESAVFRGVLSLENNGGFASVRVRTAQAVDLSGFQGLGLRARGDGKIYSLRIKTVVNGRVTPYAWEAVFRSSDDWETHFLDFSEFKPVYRGRQLSNVPPLNINAVAELGIMIKDGQEGAFELELGQLLAIAGE
ncbi:MAG: CIA30 family protein [Balneolales bacterium]|nr:CIA30 family protein [Balneolales bacterium]